MKLRDKLSFLPSPAREERAETGEVSYRDLAPPTAAPMPAVSPDNANESNAERGGNAARSSSAAPVAGIDSDRTRVLSDLRAKIAAVLGRPQPERVLPEPSQCQLGFERVEGRRGTLYRRLERLMPSHHVGNIPVDAASQVQGSMLALLALDPSLSGLRFDRALYVDTETTGLGGSGVLAFLVGLCWFDTDRRAWVEQLLLRTPGDEPALLERLHECFESCELIVSFNGKSFDLPLLQTRCVMNRMPPLPVRPHLDLLHIARRLHRKRLGVCRLTNLEEAVLGFGRGPDVASADIASRYGHFLRTADEAALEGVVLHNAWDVVSMAALVGLYGEPLGLLPAADLVGVARTLRRGGELEYAGRVAQTAVERGAGAEALRARGDISKARGDRAAALRDYEALLGEVQDPGVHLELVKLYEHYVKAPDRALELLDRGTGEKPEALARRRARLERKRAKRSAG
ncbi:MAG TPA: ribonuclease H-like domain-containing protein [Polyangiaceae bacterium]|nr:ribonuclease H-like domain-containing protein [Polyangiaceae bacterium]